MAALLSVAWAAAACSGIINDDEGDCSVTYLVGFTADYNLLRADAFGSEVQEVNLYVVGRESGRVVAAVSASASQLQDGCLKVEVPAGSYDLVAWCTGASPARQTRTDGAAAFVLPLGATVREELGVTLRRDASGEVPPVVERLFHGVLLGAEFPELEGIHRFTVPLVKDTNTLRVVLQHIDGSQPVGADDFDFTVTDSNGALAWDNSLVPDTRLTYRPWTVESHAAQMQDPDRPDASTPTATYSALAAEFTLSRLVKRTDDAPRLRICRTTDGGQVLSFPVIDLALLLRSKAYAGMDEQEFLDRQDTYDCVFFLDERDRWVNTHIYINSWLIVLQNVDL